MTVKQFTPYVYKIMEPNILVSQKKIIGNLLFGPGTIDTKEVDFSLNEWSGYISYFNSEKMYAEEPPKRIFLPQTEEKATLAAFKFIEEKFQIFERNYFLFEPFIALKRKKENIEVKFNILPNPKWLIHTHTLGVKNPNTGTLDHWLVKYVIEIETPDKEKYPVLYSSIDIRVGTFISSLKSYEIIGYNQRWRPLYEAYKVEPYLPDTGYPTEIEDDQESEQHEDDTHSKHMISEARLSYILSDENHKQNNLLLYEVESDGHHNSVLPATDVSIWVDFSITENKILAYIQGVSEDKKEIEASWFIFSYFQLDADFNLTPLPKPEKATLIEVPNFLNKNIFKIELEKEKEFLGKEVVLEVWDKKFNNFFVKQISLNISLQNAQNTIPLLSNEYYP